MGLAYKKYRDGSNFALLSVARNFGQWNGEENCLI